MFEKLFLILFRLYPLHFRKAYGQEALQLFRDRARIERGLLPGLRLWMDLLSDFAIALPRVYREGEPAVATAVGQRQSEGVPTFRVLESDSVPPTALLWGTVTALLVLAGISLLISHTVNYRPQRAIVMRQAPSSQKARLGPSSPTPGAGDAAEMGAGSSPSQAVKPAEATSVSMQPGPGNVQLDSFEQQRVIEAVTNNLKQHYFDRSVAETMGAALLAHEKNGNYKTITNGTAFAAVLTAQMREISHDMHLELIYSQRVLPVGSGGPPPPGVMEAYRNQMRAQHCMFEKVEVLPHQIGYLKLNSFPDPAVCQSTATEAMGRLNGVRAIIFDLRDNSGGYPAMVTLIAAYLFDHSQFMYSPRGGPAEQSWTRSPQPGNKLADKPVYILTSGTTWSGAEQFSYDLKMLNRATLVGETTRGGAHAGVFHRIDDHFGMGIPEEKVVNPFGKPDWEGTGVEPNVKVRAADALQTAISLAVNKVRTSP